MDTLGTWLPSGGASDPPERRAAEPCEPCDVNHEVHCKRLRSVALMDGCQGVGWCQGSLSGTRYEAWYLAYYVVSAR